MWSNHPFKLAIHLYSVNIHTSKALHLTGYICAVVNQFLRAYNIILNTVQRVLQLMSNTAKDCCYKYIIEPHMDFVSITYQGNTHSSDSASALNIKV